MVTYESFKTKEKSSWINPKVITVTYSGSCLQEQFHYKVQVKVQTGFQESGHNYSWLLTRVVAWRSSTVVCTETFKKLLRKPCSFQRQGDHDSIQWRIQGKDPVPPPSLFLDQTKAGRAENFLGETGPALSLRVWMTGPPPPPYLKV